MSLHLFSFNEPIPVARRRTLPAYFDISPAVTYDVLLLRLLTSNLGIVNNKTGHRINLQNNYTTWPSTRVARKSQTQLEAIFLPRPLTDYVNYSNKFYTRNINFYHNLLQELVFYFSYKRDKQNVAAFVNLYRTVEYLSYSVPLIHSSHFGNYIGTFSDLRSYFVDEKTSEILFFDKFIKRFFSRSAHLGYTTVFNFSNLDNTIATNCFNSFHRLMKPAEWVSAVPGTFILEIENTHLLNLIKNTRNRYFHFAVGGQRNLHSTDLADPDFFFGQINEPFLSWIAFIYASVVKENFDNAFI